eukprot:1198290-Amphidinium_carterae.4
MLNTKVSNPPTCTDELSHTHKNAKGDSVATATRPFALAEHKDRSRYAGAIDKSESCKQQNTIKL